MAYHPNGVFDLLSSAAVGLIFGPATGRDLLPRPAFIPVPMLDSAASSIADGGPSEGGMQGDGGAEVAWHDVEAMPLQDPVTGRQVRPIGSRGRAAEAGERYRQQGKGSRGR
jgi:hypothetical protein